MKAPLLLSVWLAAFLLIPSGWPANREPCHSWFARVNGYSAVPSDPLRLAVGASGALPADGAQVILWNAYKGQKGDWGRDFLQLAEGSDIILLQEVTTDPRMTHALRGVPGSDTWFAPAFAKDGVQSGVATLSKAVPRTVESVRSTPREPFLRTPKMALVQKLPITGRSDTLLVVNMHAINFVDQARYERHIREVAALLEGHQGPVLFGGDFNTWSKERKRILDRELGRYGLRQVPKNGRWPYLDLDHIYVRGLRVDTAETLRDMRSSDHSPVRLKLHFDPVTAERGL